MQAEVPIQQVLHDLANVVQTLTFISEDEPIEVGRMKLYLEKLSFLIKIYSQIYSVLDYTEANFNDLLELIQESKSQLIEVIGDHSCVPRLVKRILLLYLTWSREEIKANIETNKITIFTQDRPIRIKKLLIEQMILDKDITLEDYPDHITITWL